MFESTFIIGSKQYEKAKELYMQANVTGLKLSGPVEFRHQFVDMTKQQFTLPTGEKVIPLSHNRKSKLACIMACLFIYISFSRFLLFSVNLMNQ